MKESNNNFMTLSKLISTQATSLKVAPEIAEFPAPKAKRRREPVAWSLLYEHTKEEAVSGRHPKLNIMAQVDLMDLIKSFDANKLKDGTFTSGESQGRN